MSDEMHVTTNGQVVNAIAQGTAHTRLRELDVEEQRLCAEWERAWKEAEVAFHRRDPMALAVAFRRRREIDARRNGVRACREHVYRANYDNTATKN